MPLPTNEKEMSSSSICTGESECDCSRSSTCAESMSDESHYDGASDEERDSPNYFSARRRNPLGTNVDFDSPPYPRSCPLSADCVTPRSVEEYQTFTPSPLQRDYVVSSTPSLHYRRTHSFSSQLESPEALCSPKAKHFSSSPVLFTPRPFSTTPHNHYETHALVSDIQNYVPILTKNQVEKKKGARNDIGKIIFACCCLGLILQCAVACFLYINSNSESYLDLAKNNPIHQALRAHIKTLPSGHKVLQGRDNDPISSSHVLHSAERQMQKETDGSKEESVWQTSIADLPQSHPISPLDTLSRRMFTVRLNTFRRNDQLLLSLNHHSKCPGVAKIQVIWSDPIEEPPIEVLNHPSGKVIVERHDVDSLNERFNMLDDSPTMGIFSLDDDLLWPCEALDSAFFKWTHSPDRIVGFDSRVHVEDKDTKKWKYGYMSTTRSMNRYSMTLLRAAFVHKDYLALYMTHLPKPIFNRVQEEKNCEDIAMSLFVSAMSGSKPPLLADLWATSLMTKLYVHAHISGTHDHKQKRDACMDDFATWLDLKQDGPGQLHSSEIAHGHHRSLFEQGDPVGDIASNNLLITNREKSLLEDTKQLSWKTFVEATESILVQTRIEAHRKGYLEGSKPWKERWESSK